MRSWIDLIVEALAPDVLTTPYVWICEPLMCRLVTHDEDKLILAEVTMLVGEPVKARWFFYNRASRTGLCDSMEEAKRAVEKELGLPVCRDT